MTDDQTTPDPVEPAVEPAAPVEAPAAVVDEKPFRQVNTSGSTLHVPALLAEIGHGVEVAYHHLIPGFTRVTEKKKPVRSAGPKAADATKKE